MKYLNKLTSIAAAGLALAALSTSAAAAPLYCTAVSTTHNYMSIENSQADACLLSGTGNIGQAAHNDPFLNNAAGAGWTNISDDFSLAFTQTSGHGTWSFDSDAWSQYADLAIGFKFGTGNKPDEWFVFSVADLVSSGEYRFYNVFHRGGGLSHLVLYGSGERQVPEPGTLGLLGFGLAGLGASLRRRRKA